MFCQGRSVPFGLDVLSDVAEDGASAAASPSPRQVPEGMCYVTLSGMVSLGSVNQQLQQQQPQAIHRLLDV